MAVTPNIIREPLVYSGDHTTTNTRTPYELFSGVGCGYRNSTTNKYQTFSPYKSTSIESTSLVNKENDVCIIGNRIDGVVVKHEEDVFGQQFVLVKEYSENSSIIAKRNTYGDLYVFDFTDQGDKFQSEWFTQYDDLQYRDFMVFFDTTLIITNNIIRIQRKGVVDVLPYSSHYDVCYDDGKIYILLDMIPLNFEVYEYNQGKLNTITKESLDVTITSSNFKVKKDRFELIYNCNPDEDKLVFAEYTISDGTWNGVSTITFPYDILGAFDDGATWSIFYEDDTNPTESVIGGINFKFTPQVDEGVGLLCEPAVDLVYTYNDETGDVTPII